MGRHSSPDQGHFYRSFFGWLGLWLMIAVVTAVGVWFVVATIGGPEATRSVASGSEAKDREPEEEPEPTVSGALITKETPAPATATPTPPPSGNDEKEKAEKTKLVTEGVTVQVLNGTSDVGAAQRLADKLSGLGYSVVAVEESSRLYPKTTVFWSTDASQDAAVALAERFGWVAEPKPANLAPTVSLHVVAGADQT